MIAVNPAPANSSGNATNSATTNASSTPASPFDAILTLEALAATCASLDVAPLGGGALEGSGLESLDETQLSDTDDSDDEDGEGPLAFLVNLLNISIPAGPAPDASGAAGDQSIDDLLSSGGGQKAAADPAAALLTSAVAATDADAGTDAAGKLLLAEAAAAATDPGSTDAADQDPTNAIARAAELLAHAPRHAAAAGDKIATPVHSPRWAEDFSARVALMVRGAESTASLQLTPVDLGPVEINVTVRDSQATIHFGAAQAETRALLEASIPRLREMLAAQGFNLMDASVSQGFTRQGRSDASGVSRVDAPDSEPEAREISRVSALGLLDTYA